MPSLREPVPFGLVRVDDRLLHGQVVLNWVRLLRPHWVAIVDDALAGQGEVAGLMAATLPTGVALWIGRAGEASEALLGPAAPVPGETLVLVRGPAEAVALYDAGIRYAALNLGTLGAAPGRVRVGKQLHISRPELALLERLAADGVAVSARALPNDPQVHLREIACRVLRASSA